MLKIPITYEEQLELLKTRGIIVRDEEFCLDVLSRLNYYRLSAYILPFKTGDTYKSITFEQVYNIYDFDRRLSNLLLTTLENIELALRTKLAYYHAHKYGALGYMDTANFNTKHKHDKFMGELKRLIDNNKDNPFVKHHIDKYAGNFPIWVAVELFPFGMLSKFYADMLTKDKKHISRNEYGMEHERLESWLICFTTLRNRCAHYMRIYYYKFNKWPASIRGDGIELGNTLFDYVYAMKNTYLEKDRWNYSFLATLINLMAHFQQYIDYRHIGFPRGWGGLLKK